MKDVANPVHLHLLYSMQDRTVHFYGFLIFHTLPISVDLMVVTAFQGAVNLKVFHPGQ
jgi:hypothetical protein